MFETPITVVGRLVSDPKRRRVGAQDVVKFRLASNARRRADDGNWEPGNSLYMNVNCWGRLATGVVASLNKGDAVIVVATSTPVSTKTAKATVGRRWRCVRQPSVRTCRATLRPSAVEETLSAARRQPDSTRRTQDVEDGVTPCRRIEAPRRPCCR